MERQKVNVSDLKRGMSIRTCAGTATVRSTSCRGDMVMVRTTLGFIARKCSATVTLAAPAVKRRINAQGVR